MALDPNSLTVDYKSLLKLSVSDRVAFARSGQGQSYLASLSPIQLAQLFPGYWRNAIKVAGSAGGGSASTFTSGGTGNYSSPSSASPTSDAMPSGPAPSTSYRPPWYNRYMGIASEGSGETAAATSNQQQAGSGETLAGINSHQLAFIRGIGATESGFRYSEAYSEAYNKKSNNANVRKYGSKGADYGYYQTNELDVQDAIRLGVPPHIARHLNGGGQGGKSTVEQQTLAMHEYLSRRYPSEYNALTSGDPNAYEVARKKMDGKWFGLRDRPNVARQEFQKGSGPAHEIFPGADFSNIPKQDEAVTGALNPEPGLRPSDVTKQNSKDIIGRAANGEQINEKIIAKALTIEGLHEKRDRDLIMDYLDVGGRRKGVNPATTPWCADFINATLAHNNVKGSGSAVATSFSEWGVKVEADKVMSGDVLVQHKGRRPGVTGGHVGFATGRTKVDKNGNLLIEMYGGNQTTEGSGNDGVTANKKWVRASELYVRRAPEVVESQQNGGSPVQSVDRPSSFEKLPQEIRTEIGNLSYEDQNALFQKMREQESAGVDVVGDLTQYYQSAPRSGDPAVLAVKTLSEAPPGEIPQNIGEQELYKPEVAIGRALQKIGMQISDHPEFSGIDRDTQKGQGHAEDRAFEVRMRNYDTNDPVQKSIFDKVSAWGQRNGYKATSGPEGFRIEAMKGSQPRPDFQPSELSALINQFDEKEREYFNKNLGIDLNSILKQPEAMPSPSREATAPAPQPTATPVEEQFATNDNPFKGITFPEGMPQPNLTALSPEYKRWASLQDRAALQKRIDEGWQNTDGLKRTFANSDNVASSMNKKFKERISQMKPEEREKIMTDLQSKRDAEIKAAKEVAAQANAGDPPKSEPAKVETPEATKTAPESTKTAPEATKTEPPKEEVPKMRTGGDVRVDPRDPYSVTNEITGEKVARVAEGEKVRVENGRLTGVPEQRIDPADTHDRSQSRTSDQIAESQEIAQENKAGMTSSTVPMTYPANKRHADTTDTSYRPLQNNAMGKKMAEIRGPRHVSRLV